jgi:MFS family permease
MNDGNESSSRWHVFLATWLAGFFVAMDSSIFGIILHPALSELLHTKSDSEIGWIGAVIMAAFMLGWSLGASILGVVADYLGRVKTLILTILLYAIATALCAISHSWGELAVYRFFVGLGIGGEISISAVLLSEYWEESTRAYAISCMWTSFSLGMLATAILNAVLGQFGWRYLFVTGIAPAFITIYIRATLKESDDFNKVVEARKNIAHKLTGDLTTEEKKLRRLPIAEILSYENRAKTLLFASIAAVAMIGYWASLSWVPAWINQITGSLAVNERSTAGIVMALGMLFASASGGWLMKHIGAKNSLLLGFGGAFATSISMFLTVKSYGIALLLWAFVAMFLAQIPFIILPIYIPKLFDANVRSTALGFCYDGLGRAITAIASLAGGGLITLFGGSYAIAAACMTSVYLSGIVLAFYLPGSRPRNPDTTAGA